MGKVCSTYNLKEIGCEGVDWIHLTLRYGSVAASCEYVNETYGSIRRRRIS
jgi:hypothetical protein